MPLYLPPLCAMASVTTRLSNPCRVALTITARCTPIFSCRARNIGSGASGGVYGRVGENGYSAFGPKMWVWVSTVPAGTLKTGVFVFRSGPAMVGIFLGSAGAFSAAHDWLAASADRAPALAAPVRNVRLSMLACSLAGIRLV